MTVVLLLAAAVILGGVVVAALGGAGEMAAFPADHPPLDAADFGPGDVFALRAPMSLWGYHVAFVDEVMASIAKSMAVREAQLADLRAEVAELRGRGAGPAPAPAQAPAEPASLAEAPAQPGQGADG